MKITEPKKTKVKFELEIDKDGYPPVAVEGIWCNDLGNGTYQVDNIPFYVYEISLKDVIAVKEHEGCFWYNSLVEPSDHSTIRVFFLKNCAKHRTDEALKFIHDYGAIYEGFGDDFRLYAIDVPGDADYLSIIQYLRAGEIDNYWHVEESSYRHEI